METGSIQDDAQRLSLKDDDEPVKEDLTTIIFDELTEDDVISIKFLCQPWISSLNSRPNTNGKEFVKSVLKQTFPEESKMKEALKEILFTVKRFDLLKRLSVCKHNFKPSENILDSKWKEWYFAVDNLDPRNGNATRGFLMPVMTDESISQHLLAESFSCFFCKDLIEDVQRTVESSKESYYPMRSFPCGICTIINNKNFSDPEYKIRKGSDVDRDALKRTFELFDFKTEIHEEKNSFEIKSIINDLATRDHSRYDCLVFCILTHGEPEVVLGTDCKEINIQDEILAPFRTHIESNHLDGKPRLFFIQACQGNQIMPRAGCRPRPSGSDTVTHNAPEKTYPDELVCMSTVPGFLSFRSPLTGSWFITTLVKQLKSFGSQKGILDVMVQVNNEVAAKEDFYTEKDELNRPIARFQVKQMPIQRITLRKTLKFRAK